MEIVWTDDVEPRASISDAQVGPQRFQRSFRDIPHYGVTGVAGHNAYLGNLDALRDWGHARDYVDMQWRMLQQDKPEDFVIATGEQHSVRSFVDLAAANVGVVLTWHGQGDEEYATIKSIDNDVVQSKVGDKVVAVSPEFYRPAEVESLLGDPAKAKKELDWHPQTSFQQLVDEMMQYDFERN